MKNIFGHHRIDFPSNESLTCLWISNSKDYGSTWKDYSRGSNVPFSVQKNEFDFVAFSKGFRITKLNQNYFCVWSDKDERHPTEPGLPKSSLENNHILTIFKYRATTSSSVAGRNHHNISETAAGTGCCNFSLGTIRHYKGTCTLERTSSVSYTVTSQAQLKIATSKEKKINAFHATL